MAVLVQGVVTKSGWCETDCPYGEENRYYAGSLHLRRVASLSCRACAFHLGSKGKLVNCNYEALKNETQRQHEEYLAQPES